MRSAANPCDTVRMLLRNGEAHECLVRDQQGHEQGESIFVSSADHDYGASHDTEETIEAESC